jgi:hypothetical protein|tara:strand:+ start:202 stop:615 length:414 start_codon:yes stop_codon:yes gene_type:complete
MTTPDIFTGFRKERATLFAQKIASAAIGAFNNALSGFFTVGCGNLWGASSQRALAAFENNEDEVKNWCKKGYPGFGGASLKHKEVSNDEQFFLSVPKLTLQHTIVGQIHRSEGKNVFGLRPPGKFEGISQLVQLPLD